MIIRRKVWHKRLKQNKRSTIKKKNSHHIKFISETPKGRSKWKKKKTKTKKKNNNNKNSNSLKEQNKKKK